MNIKTLNNLKATAQRTLDILDLLEKGRSIKEIVQDTGASRQLVEYYIKVVGEINQRS